MQILTACHRILSYLLWYSTMVIVGRSVRSYVCADLLSTSTREGSPSKGGVQMHPLPPLDPPLISLYNNGYRIRQEHDH